MVKKPCVFISSTIKDLHDERTSLEEIINTDYNFDAFVSEQEGAKSESSYKICKDNIRNADFVILILGKRYGYIPEARDDTPFNGEISVTRGEYEIAKKYNIPLIIYIKEVDNYDEKQKEFIDHVRNFFKGSYTTNFKDATSLKNKIKADISNLLSQLIKNEYRFPYQKHPLVVRCNTDEWNGVKSTVDPWNGVKSTVDPCSELIRVKGRLDPIFVRPHFR